MSAVRALKVRTRDAVRKWTAPDGELPRRGYTHFFIESEGMHSRLHLHHFYSLFLPELDDQVQIHMRVHDAAGRSLGTVTRALAPFASVTLPVSELLGELGSSAEMGTVVVDVEPASPHTEALRHVGPVGAIAQSPFWMGFFDDAGSVAYVHSIDQNYDEVFGVGRLAGLAYKVRPRPGERWTSKRLIEARGLKQLDAFLVNHGPTEGRTTLRWLAHPRDRVVLEEDLVVAGRGVARVTLTAADLDAAGDPAETEFLHLEVEDLLTPNGKPYLMSRYRDGPFSLHHG